ncbi:MAG: hypothetical protein ACYTCU_04625 [Planctomycetota bacterium]|jgi:hypothetical protein
MPRQRLGPSSNTRAARTIAFTIVAKNYLAYARTLMASVAHAHPTWRRVVVLCDEVDGVFDPSDAPYEMVTASELGIDRFEEMAFRYSVLELSTAIKPSAFRRLLDDPDCERVVYLDPDLFLYRPLVPVQQLLDDGALMVLTPHLTQPVDDDRHPGELDILRAGTFNLGFLALARRPDTPRFLDWWESHLADGCVVDLERGLFVDQKWMDLVPGLFPDVAILRHAGCNLAYWNLAQRPVKAHVDGSVTAAGEPLLFAHFSGVDPGDPSSLSKHQDRFRLSETGAFRALVEEYCRVLHDNGHDTCRRWSYHYDTGTGSVRVNEFVRRMYRDDEALQRKAGSDPYSLMPELANEPVDARHPEISRLMMHLWRARPDLRRSFPRPFDEDKEDFVTWFARDSRKEGLDLDPHYYRPVEDGLTAPPDTLTVSGGLVQAMFRLKRMIPSGSLRRVVRRALVGRHPLEGEPEPDPPPVAPTTLGANLIGYTRAETGIGESVRLAAQSLRAAEAPFSLVRFHTGDASRHGDARFAELETASNAHFANVWHVNADQTQHAFDHFGPAFTRGRINIGVWHWELPEMPPAQRAAIDLIDEFWAPSRFVQSMLEQLTDKTVLHMPHGVRIPPQDGWRREEFGLPEGKTLLLCMFDVLSVTARKNPEGVLAAFREAAGERRDVALVVKVGHAKEADDAYRTFRAEASAMPNVR